jgi:hypothetical protein
VETPENLPKPPTRESSKKVKSYLK